MTNNALIPFLVTMMLVTGVCNTILNKYQVSPGVMAAVKDILANRFSSNRICNVCGTVIHPNPATESSSSSQSFKRKAHPKLARDKAVQPEQQVLTAN
jgi:hypothetical protein